MQEKEIQPGVFLLSSKKFLSEKKESPYPEDFPEDETIKGYSWWVVTDNGFCSGYLFFPEGEEDLEHPDIEYLPEE